MTDLPRIFITPGEPAGIGPDVVIQIAQREWPAECVVIADAALLMARAEQLQLPLTLTPVDFSQAAQPQRAGELRILSVPLVAPARAGELDVRNAAYVLECLKIAVEHCCQQPNSALVTGPVHKGIINQAGIPFTGHTEFLATACGVSEPIMLFVVDRLKVALATTHIRLAEVPEAITARLLTTLIRRLHRELQRCFRLPNPAILVAGVNPHAGEEGLLGREEIDIMQPALEALRHEGINVLGPLPADTLFTPKMLLIADAIVAMYHDQALPVVKNTGFDRAVNVTLGLPIIRTSVDHGTALDIAGTLEADPGSLGSAITLALQLLANTSG